MIRNIVPAALALMTTLAATCVHSQEPYPARPIRVIVPYAAGGVVDVQARAVAQRMAAELGQPMVIEARPGANGNIAAEFVARAPADGYTLLVSAPFLVNNPLMEDQLRWAPANFAPVGRFALAPSYFVVPANSPAGTVKDFVAMARKSPRPLQFGDGGVGSTQNMANEMFKIAAGIPLEAVSYKGAPPMVPDLINGAFAMAILPSSVAHAHIRSGALRALANISSTRSSQFPEVPTIAEAGYPDVTALSWYGFHVPTGTPPEAIRKLDAALKKATAVPETRERLVNAGGEEAYLDQGDFTKFIQADALRWAKVAKAIRK